MCDENIGIITLIKIQLGRDKNIPVNVVTRERTHVVQ
jgi:hypothetical protein